MPSFQTSNGDECLVGLAVAVDDLMIHEVKAE